jgi:hypothetical protein
MFGSFIIGFLLLYLASFGLVQFWQKTLATDSLIWQTTSTAIIICQELKVILKH